MLHWRRTLLHHIFIDHFLISFNTLYSIIFIAEKQRKGDRAQEKIFL